MIITSDKPFTTEQIAILKEAFDVYIKTVIDIEKKNLQYWSFYSCRQ